MIKSVELKEKSNSSLTNPVIEENLNLINYPNEIGNTKSESDDSHYKLENDENMGEKKKKQGRWKRDARKRKEITSQEKLSEKEFLVGEKRSASPMDIDQVTPKTKSKVDMMNVEIMGVVAALN